MYRIYTFLASFDDELFPKFFMNNLPFPVFSVQNHRDPHFMSTFRQFLNHANSNPALVVKHDHILTFRRPFVLPKQEVDFTSVYEIGNIFCSTALVRRKFTRR